MYKGINCQIKTPDAEIIGYGIWDFKNISPTARPKNIEKNIEDYVLATRRQAPNIAFNLADNSNVTSSMVNQGVENAISTAQFSENLSALPDQISVVYSDGSFKIITLSDFINGTRF